MSYKNAFIQSKTKLLLTIFIIFNITYSLFCQNNKYTVYNDYDTDSLGISILQKNVKYQRISDSNSWGFQDSLGNIVIPLGKYKFLNPMDKQGMILAKKDGKDGYIDIDENILIPFIYDDLGVFSDEVDLAPAVKNKKQGFVNRKGQTVIPFEYDYSSFVRYFYEPGIAVLLKNKKFGVINTKNEVIIPFVYSKIDFERRNDFVIAWQQEKWACFSTEGKQLSDFNTYEIVEKPLGYSPPNSENLPILIKIEGDKNFFAELYRNTAYLNASEKEQRKLEAQGGTKFAFLDKEQKFIVSFGEYDYADVFGLGRKAIVGNEGKYGIIDEFGKLALPLEYDFVEQPSIYSNYANIFIASKGNSAIILDEKMNKLPIKGIVSYWEKYDNIFVKNLENKIGLVDYSGRLTIPFLYDTLYQEHSVPRTEGYIAKKNGFYGFVSRTNRIIQPFEYKFIYILNGNAVFVNQNDKVGMFDENGKLIIPFEYDAIYPTYYNDFNKTFPDIENIYMVERNGKFGTVDDKNNVVIPATYDGLSGWVEYGPDAHFVKNNEKYGIISHKGKMIIPIIYEYIGLPQNGLIQVKQNGKQGVITWENEEILPCVFDDVILDIPMFEIDDSKQKPKIVALQNNKWSYYDLKGKLLRSNVPLKDINEKYDYIINRSEPSNENYDFDIKQIGWLKMKIKEENVQGNSH